MGTVRVARARNLVARSRELGRANRALNNEVKLIQGRSHSGHEFRGHSHDIPVRISWRLELYVPAGIFVATRHEIPGPRTDSPPALPSVFTPVLGGRSL